LVMQKIKEIPASIKRFKDIDYYPKFEWDVNQSGFSYHHDTKKKVRKKQSPRHFDGYSFYEAMQIRQYGDTNTSFPIYYLEDMDEVELSGSEIDDLDGAQYCIHTISMDLSGNHIADLSPLSGLKNLEELNLAGNQLSYIDALSNFQQLKRLDLSNNQIDDISPLFEIESLEYVDLTGNKIQQRQLKELKMLEINFDT